MRARGIDVSFPSTVGGLVATTLSATVLAEDAGLDTCILLLNSSLDRQPILLDATLPREGIQWRSFGFPKDKSALVTI